MRWIVANRQMMVDSSSLDVLRGNERGRGAGAEFESADVLCLDIKKLLRITQ